MNIENRLKGKNLLVKFYPNVVIFCLLLSLYNKNGVLFNLLKTSLIYLTEKIESIL